MRRGIFRGVVATLAALLGAGAAGPSPTRSGIDRTYVSADIRPQDDLFRHVNGKWLTEAAIPPDRPLDGAFYKLRDKSEADIRAIIEESTKADAPAGSEARKIGDL